MITARSVPRASAIIGTYILTQSRNLQSADVIDTPTMRSTRTERMSGSVAIASSESDAVSGGMSRPHVESCTLNTRCELRPSTGPTRLCAPQIGLLANLNGTRIPVYLILKEPAAGEP